MNRIKEWKQRIESKNRIKESKQRIESKNRIKESNQRIESKNRISESNPRNESKNLNTRTLTLEPYIRHLNDTPHRADDFLNGF